MTSELLRFMAENPWLTAWLALLLVYVVLCIVWRLPNRLIRHLNIRKAGWPPPYCDADGEAVDEDP